MPDKSSAISTKTAKPRGRPWQPGQSGNPSGRPKRSEAQQEALEAIRDLAPMAAEVLQQIMTSASTPPAVRVKVAEIVLERTYGKPDQPVKVRTDVTSIMEDVRREMESVRADSDG